MLSKTTSSDDEESQHGTPCVIPVFHPNLKKDQPIGEDIKQKRNAGGTRNDQSCGSVDIAV